MSESRRIEEVDEEELLAAQIREENIKQKKLQRPSQIDWSQPSKRTAEAKNATGDNLLKSKRPAMRRSVSASQMMKDTSLKVQDLTNDKDSDDNQSRGHNSLSAISTSKSGDGRLSFTLKRKNASGRYKAYNDGDSVTSASRFEQSLTNLRMSMSMSMQNLNTTMKDSSTRSLGIAGASTQSLGIAGAATAATANLLQESFSHTVATESGAGTSSHAGHRRSVIRGCNTCTTKTRSLSPMRRSTQTPEPLSLETASVHIPKPPIASRISSTRSLATSQRHDAIPAALLQLQMDNTTFAGGTIAMTNTDGTININNENGEDVPSKVVLDFGASFHDTRNMLENDPLGDSSLGSSRFGGSFASSRRSSRSHRRRPPALGEDQPMNDSSACLSALMGESSRLSATSSRRSRRSHRSERSSQRKKRREKTSLPPPPLKPFQNKNTASREYPLCLPSQSVLGYDSVPLIVVQQPRELNNSTNALPGYNSEGDSLATASFHTLGDLSESESESESETSHETHNYAQMYQQPRGLTPRRCASMSHNNNSNFNGNNNNLSSAPKSGASATGSLKNKKGPAAPAPEPAGRRGTLLKSNSMSRLVQNNKRTDGPGKLFRASTGSSVAGGSNANKSKASRRGNLQRSFTGGSACGSSSRRGNLQRSFTGGSSCSRSRTKAKMMKSLSTRALDVASSFVTGSRIRRLNSTSKRPSPLI